MVKEPVPKDPSEHHESPPDWSVEFFQVRRHGEVAVIVPTAQIEHLAETLLQPAAQMVLEPLRRDPPEHIVVDLSNVSYFGSSFITFLLRCYEIVKPRGSELVLAGVKADSPIRELLHTTALDMLWAIYDTPQEALTALRSSY
ncbi:MAG: STAS domain-containing protein [Gemmataceae bacterium]|nr:STAS domain-containing protein [Gemmataceae bacterium]